MNVKTEDITLAAYLRMRLGRIDDISLPGKMGQFHFDNVDDTLIAEYDMGKALVEPQLFHNAIRSLTTAINRMKRS